MKNLLTVIEAFVFGIFCEIFIRVVQDESVNSQVVRLPPERLSALSCNNQSILSHRSLHLYVVCVIYMRWISHLTRKSAQNTGTSQSSGTESSFLRMSFHIFSIQTKRTVFWSFNVCWITSWTRILLPVELTRFFKACKIFSGSPDVSVIIQF